MIDKSPENVWLRCALISDSHLSSDRQGSSYGANPYDALSAALRYLAELPVDCIIHLGDTIQDRQRESYRLLRSILEECPLPVYIVNGNHDSPALLHEEIGTPLRAHPDKARSIDYSFTVKGRRFLVLDSCHPDQRDPLGRISSDQLAWLENELRGDECAEGRQGAGKSVVCVHHLPFRMGSAWVDENMVIVNSDDLHAVLLRCRDRIELVLHGHLHRPTMIVRDRIVYAGVPSVAWQYLWEAWRAGPEVDPLTPPSYGLLEFCGSRVQLSWYPVMAGAEIDTASPALYNNQ